MNRDIRKGIAEDTLRILEDGYYMVNGRIKIDIKPLQEKAEALTKVYSPKESDLLITKSYKQEGLNTHIIVTNQSTLVAVGDMIAEGKTDVVCLNFASARNAGGGFLNGSQAQEESLARSTGLYNCQIKTTGYYETNRKIKTCFYTDNMIYSPFVPIIKDDNGVNMTTQQYCAIITAPAVNTGVVKQRERKKVKDIEEVMKRRIRKVLAIALENKHKNIVLGAWGCGVFQNDPIEIAKYFEEVLSTDFANCFEKIVFAIYAKNTRFIEAFQAEFGS